MPGDAAFVWIWLPRRTDPVVCGSITTNRETEGLRGSFVYAADYLKYTGAQTLDPVRLPLVPEPLLFTRLSGIPSVLLDAGPDAWGRSIIDRIHGRQVSPLGYLLRCSDGAGSLGFSTSRNNFSSSADSASFASPDALAYVVEALDGDTQIDLKSLPALQTLSPGIGGARPKVTFYRQGFGWIAKFPSDKDIGRISNPLLECFGLKLARQCGITTVQYQLEQLGDKDVLLVKRFDRTVKAGQIYRHAFLSGRTLLQADVALARYAFSGSYQRLASSLKSYSIQPEEDQLELFRRLCFNVIIGNTDDHELNHGLVNIDGKGFVLSPAYDLVPQRHHSATPRGHALQIGPDFQGSRENVISCAKAFSLETHSAVQIFDSMREQIRDTWQDVAYEVGFDDADCRFLDW